METGFRARHTDTSVILCISREIVEQCQGAVCLLNQYVKTDERVFKGVPTLKMIARYGVGVDNVNVDDATKYGVQVCDVPDYCGCGG
jgi:D-3-phosphoglycerate dehydrogenase